MLAALAPHCYSSLVRAPVANGLSMVTRSAAGRPLTAAVLHGRPRQLTGAAALDCRLSLSPGQGRGQAVLAASAVASALSVAKRRRSIHMATRGTATSATPVRDADFERGMGEAAATYVGSGMQVILVPCLSDNYAPVFHDPVTGATAVVDSPEVGPILAALESRGWTLTHILNTHHHWDHTGGNEEIKKLTHCHIVGPAGEASRIPGIDLAVSEGEHVKVGSLNAVVLEVGGHTSGHIAYHFPEQNVAFVGDTLFNLGCGRLFEGTATQMFNSLSKLCALPDETVIYCAHEYTEANARFASHLGGVPKLAGRVAVIKELRQQGKATVPMLLGHEKETNPFLRSDSEELREAVGLRKGALPVQVFAEVRRRKDKF